MDTGAYMQNQMDDQISASQEQFQFYCQKLDEEIAAFIKECNYTFDSAHIFNEYSNKYSKGIYVSHTTKIVIKQFEKKLKLIYP